MHKHHNRKVPSVVFALVSAGVAAVAGSAAAEDNMKVTQDPGYTIESMSGSGAEGLLPRAASKQEVTAASMQELPIVRPGFGYTINFMTGPAAEALFPPGWAAERRLTNPSRN
jgi:hypothetical protein